MAISRNRFRPKKSEQETVDHAHQFIPNVRKRVDQDSHAPVLCNEYSCPKFYHCLRAGPQSRVSLEWTTVYHLPGEKYDLCSWKKKTSQDHQVVPSSVTPIPKMSHYLTPERGPSSEQAAPSPWTVYLFRNFYIPMGTRAGRIVAVTGRGAMPAETDPGRPADRHNRHDTTAQTYLRRPRTAQTYLRKPQLHKRTGGRSQTGRQAGRWPQAGAPHQRHLPLN
ncbi:hypothetical protein AAG570_011457 [Ranatra chinensis]|uniref:Uncharacterized protein n=1 Tax=Ranatra chinensis TaxID=642074 RepID=A0ABD0YKQ4_9HEMI